MAGTTSWIYAVCEDLITSVTERKSMKRIVITTNIPSPYRVDLYDYLQTHLTQYHFDIVYSARGMTNREWGVAEEKLGNAHFLQSKTLERQQTLDRHVTHISTETGKLLDELQPDVVIAMEYNPVALQCAWWCKTHRKPLIHLTDGTLYSERNINIVQKLSRKFIFYVADACIASSTKAKEKCIAWGMPQERVFVSLLTEEIAPYRRIEREPISGRILYVGSMIKRKGLDLLVRALARVPSQYELHIVGNGSAEEKEELLTLAKQLGVEQKIVFGGFLEREALWEEFQKADFFVLPTRADCFGLVLLEAAAAGVPILTSKYADGAYDIVTEKDWIFDPEDTQEFAQKMDQFLNSKEKETTAEQIRKATERFAFENTVRGYCAAIEDVTKNKRYS